MAGETPDIVEELHQLQEKINNRLPEELIAKNAGLHNALDKLAKRLHDKEDDLVLAFAEMQEDMDEFTDFMDDSNYTEDDSLIKSSKMLSRSTKRLVDRVLQIVKILAEGLDESIDKYSVETELNAKLADVPTEPMPYEREPENPFDNLKLDEGKQNVTG